MAEAIRIKGFVFLMSFRKYILLVFLAAFLCGNAFGAVGVRVQVDTDGVIYAGEGFGYHIILDGVRQVGQVDISPLDAYTPQYAGGSDRSQKSISIINGKKAERVSEYYVMSYRLTSDKGGQVTLAGVDVVIDGKTYRTNEVTVNIVEPERTERLDLTVELSKDKCYVGEPVLLTVKWFIRDTIAKPGVVAGVSFNVPVLKSNDFYIENALVDRPAGANKPLGLMINGVQAAFVQQNVVHKGLDWVELSSSFVLIPRRAGSLLVDETSVSVDLAVGERVRSLWGTKRQSKRFIERVASSRLKVIEVPQEGKPEFFYGLVGKYSIHTLSDLTSVDVGQPIELTIRIGGRNYLKPVRWPKLEEIDELAENFRVSDEREDGVILGLKKVFKTMIRAQNDSVERIPPIPLAYFDVDEGKYVIVESDPIELDVRHSEVVTFEDAEMLGVGKANRQIEAIKKGISANFEDVELVSEDFSPIAGLVSGGFAAVWGIPLAGFVMSLIFKIATYRDEKSVARKRRRQALNKAVGRLKHVRGLGKAEFEKSGKGAIAAAMREYVGDRFAKTAGSLTGMDCQRVVLEATADEEMAKRYREIMEGFEASSYSPGARGGDVGDVEGIIELLKAVEKKV